MSLPVKSRRISAILLAVAVLLMMSVGCFTSCQREDCGSRVPSVYKYGSNHESSDESESENPSASGEDTSDEVSSQEEVSSEETEPSSTTEPPKITTQPKSAAVSKNSSVKISVKAKGKGLKYQWYFKTDAETDYSARKGLTHASETVKHDGTWNELRCYCLVTDSAGNTAASDAAIITLEKPMKLLAVGDSICRGGRNSRKGFVGDLGLPYVNLGQNGATLSTKETAVTNIPEQLAGVSDYTPDIIIADGGVNDYIYNAPLGKVPTAMAASVNKLSDDDLATAMGGLQKLFVLMRSNFPHAKRYFVITHKTTQRVPKVENGKYVYTDNDRYVDWTVTKNKAGYTQKELHDAIVSCCKVYGVEVIDIYQNSALNTADLTYCSDTSYFDDPTVTDRECVDIDGVHPLDKGYSEYYLPLIRKQIKTTPQAAALPLEILIQPTSKGITLGDPLTVSLKASGTKLSYQWFYQKAGQTSFSEWKGRTHESETVTPNASWNGIQLYCVVTDSQGETVKSNIITVTVK